jgi:hypothetical protein
MMKGSTVIWEREEDIPLRLLAASNRSLSRVVDNMKMASTMITVEMNRVVFLPIRSEMAPPGRRKRAEKMRWEETMRPKKLAENPISKMYKFKITVKIPILTVFRA